MEGAASQWIGLGSVVLFGAMALSPFVFTWINCDRPEPYLKRCLRTTVSSVIVMAISAAILLAFFPPHFPEGQVWSRVQETAGQSLLVAVIAPLFGTDFLMRMKLKYKWFRARGHHEL